MNIDEALYQPLYEGAKLSILDSYFQLMQFSLRHSLTKQAFSDLLNVICYWCALVSKSNYVGLQTQGIPV